MRTANLDGQLLGMAVGVALGSSLVWALLALGLGSPLGFLIIPLGGGVGYALATCTLERSLRLVGLAMGLTLVGFLFSKSVCAQFAGQTLLATRLQEDEASMRRTVYAAEIQEMMEKGRAPGALKEWLQDTEQAPPEKIRLAVEEYLVLGTKRFLQRSPEEQEKIILHHAMGVRVKEGFWGGLRLFLGWIDLLWLAIGVWLSGYLASGTMDRKIVHLQVEEVPEARSDKFLDLDFS